MICARTTPQEFAMLRAAVPASVEEDKLLPKTPEEIEEPEVRLTDEDRAFYKYVTDVGLDWSVTGTIWQHFQSVQAAMREEDERANKRIDQIVVRHKPFTHFIEVVITLDDGRTFKTSHPISDRDSQMTLNGRAVRTDAK